MCGVADVVICAVKCIPALCDRIVIINTPLPTHPHNTHTHSGDEASSIAAFRDALGLDDTDAAAVHIDVGRRILRSRFESSGRGADVEQRKTFQKLIYVSTGVFGEQKAAYLLPWKRVFELTDAQIVVAKRDNAKTLFVNYLKKQGDFQATRGFLEQVKGFAESIRCSEDIALEALQESTQSTVQQALDAAVECAKQRTRVKDYTVAMQVGCVWCVRGCI